MSEDISHRQSNPTDSTHMYTAHIRCLPTSVLSASGHGSEYPTPSQPAYIQLPSTLLLR